MQKNSCRYERAAQITFQKKKKAKLHNSISLFAWPRLYHAFATGMICASRCTPSCRFPGHAGWHVLGPAVPPPPVGGLLSVPLILGYGGLAGSWRWAGARLKLSLASLEKKHESAVPGKMPGAGCFVRHHSLVNAP